MLQADTEKGHMPWADMVQADKARHSRAGKPQAGREGGGRMHDPAASPSVSFPASTCDSGS